MATDETKYTRVEYERRFLVPFLVPSYADRRSAVESYSKIFEDKYIRGARLRLRVQTDTDTGRRLIKLTKKSESSSPYFSAISRILLSPSEHELLDSLDGNRLKKIRHYHLYHGRVFSIDVFEGELQGLILCETEADALDELMAVEAPKYTTHEVTEDPFFTGGNLCRIKNTELRDKLSIFR